MKKSLIIIIFFCLFSFCPINTPIAKATEQESFPKASKILQIPIPGVTLSEPEPIEKEKDLNSTTTATVREISIPWMAEYITGLYNYALIFSSIVAVLMLVAGGFMYVYSGVSPDNIKKAKDIISGSILGLILLMSSYTMLKIINPKLVDLQPINIYSIKEITFQIIGDTTSAVGSSTPNCVGITGFSGGTSDEKRSAVIKAAQSMMGRTTYIFGAKDGPGCTAASGKYKACIDCSGLVGYAYKCGIGENVPAGTSNLFASGTFKITKEADLKPGDIIGWKAGEGGQTYGHVGIYIGGDTIIHSHGPKEREDQAVSTMSLSAWLKKYPFTKGKKIIND